MPKVGDGLFGLKVDLSCVETASVCTHTSLRITPEKPVILIGRATLPTLVDVDIHYYV